MSFSRNADPCEPFPARPFGSCSRPRNELASLSTHRVVDHPCIFMRHKGAPITHASAEKSAPLACMLTRWPACSLAVLRLGLFCGGNSAGWRLGSGPGADFHAVLDREGDGQVPGPRAG
jgi:hypothetical protein